MKNRAQWLMAALALTAVAGAVYARTTDGSTGSIASAPAPGARHWHPDGRTMGGGMMHALHQLNLSDAQKQNVKQILVNARTQFKSERQSAGTPDFAALSNPGDPNHAAALQNLQARVTARIQARDQLQLQIYGVLTTEQKTQLASVLAARQAKMAQHGAT
jgi:protein CpxP